MTTEEQPGKSAPAGAYRSGRGMILPVLTNVPGKPLPSRVSRQFPCPEFTALKSLIKNAMLRSGPQHNRFPLSPEGTQR
jgi:hypothetical protein